MGVTDCVVCNKPPCTKLSHYCYKALKWINELYEFKQCDWCQSRLLICTVLQKSFYLFYSRIKYKRKLPEILKANQCYGRWDNYAYESCWTCVSIAVHCVTNPAINHLLLFPQLKALQRISKKDIATSTLYRRKIPDS